MWQYVMALGLESPEVKEIFKKISIQETNLKTENESIELCKEIITSEKKR